MGISIFAGSIRSKGEIDHESKNITQSLKIFETIRELDELDHHTNNFISEAGVNKIISVSDTTTTGNDGTIGIIRVLAYED